MPLLKPQYFLLWKDAGGDQASTALYAVDDAAAIIVASNAQACSLAKLVSVFKVEQLDVQGEAEPAVGSNIRSKAWFTYTTALSKIVRLSVPAFDTSLAGQDGRTVAVDVLQGASRLTTRAGNPATAFVKGVWNYGLRKRDIEG